jgi:hypothetical protein
MKALVSKMDIIEAIKVVQGFASISLTNRIAKLEFALSSQKLEGIVTHLNSEYIDGSLVKAAFEIKRVAAQINVIIHAVGILVSLPHILENGEIVESLSLGAGNTGRGFDLKTNLRVAEFKFIEWQGGPESIRQNSLFYDFFSLAEHDSHRKRCLYLLGTDEGLKFLQGNRSLESVLSKSKKIRDQFYTYYPNQFFVVSDYYKAKKSTVEILDLKKLIPSIWGVY